MTAIENTDTPKDQIKPLSHKFKIEIIKKVPDDKVKPK
jgi:hypothetical protein